MSTLTRGEADARQSRRVTLTAENDDSRNVRKCVKESQAEVRCGTQKGCLQDQQGTLEAEVGVRPTLHGLVEHLVVRAT